MLKTLIKSKPFENSKKPTGKSPSKRKENCGKFCFCALRCSKEFNVDVELTTDPTDAIKISLLLNDFKHEAMFESANYKLISLIN